MVRSRSPVVCTRDTECMMYDVAGGVVHRAGHRVSCCCVEELPEAQCWVNECVFNNSSGPLLVGHQSHDTVTCQAARMCIHP